MKIKTVMLILGLSLIVLCSACSSWFNDPTPDSEKALQSAWEYFEMTNYDMAYSKFESVISMDPGNSEAYNGRGWCYLLLNDLENAEIDFTTSIDKGYIELDPHAGLAAVYVSSDEFTEAISEAEYVLTQNPDYVFQYASEINYLDMHLILAMAYFHTGDFQNSYNHILALDPAVIIDENDSSTWTMNGHQYASYAEVLMAIIDKLDAQYGFYD